MDWLSCESTSFGDGHDSKKQHAEVDRSQIVLQHLENRDLQNAAFLDHHGGGITLPFSVQPVTVCRIRLSSLLPSGLNACRV